jgi:HEAT repeat protein
MIFYCTNCWKEINKDILTCPYCGADQNELMNATFNDKLIKALNHPEPQTQIRAANILAHLKMKESVPHLLNKLENEKDPYIIKAIVLALIKIDLRRAKSSILKILGVNPPITVKHLIDELEKDKNGR